ncbi:GIY-YIG nuclease family protein [Candidatus Daviesbacteria bacterium]|nr:GIY-YIG nuclease family protein [Candidatus Daviesbacteria bacterium]
MVLFTVYILRTSANTLYIGQTNDLAKRLKEHQNKSSKSARYIKYFDSCKLVYSEQYPTRIEAMRREWQLKKWTKAKKEALVNGRLEPISKRHREPRRGVAILISKDCHVTRYARSSQ